MAKKPQRKLSEFSSTQWGFSKEKSVEPPINKRSLNFHSPVETKGSPGFSNRQKVVTDWIIATQETVYTLQVWLGLLENWRDLGRAEAEDFSDACQQLKDAGLWQWAGEAGGHGVAALARAVEISEFYPDRETDGR